MLINKTTKINCCCGSSYLYKNGTGYTNHIASQKHKKFHIKYLIDCNKSEYGIPELRDDLSTYDEHNELIWHITFNSFLDIIEMLNNNESEDENENENENE